MISISVSHSQMRATSSGIEVAVNKAVIEGLDRASFAFNYGVEKMPESSTHFAGIALTCANPEGIAARAVKLGIPTFEKANGVILLPDADCTTAIRFERVKQA